MAPTPSSSDGDFHFGGTITWSTKSDWILDRSPDLPPAYRHETLEGTAQVVLLVRDSGYDYELSAERDGGSTYSYDYSFHRDDGEECVTHETGVLETFAGVPDADFGDWSIGMLNVSGGLFDDLELSFAINDWCGASLGDVIPDELKGEVILGFPFCPEDSVDLIAEFDGSSSYVIDCSYEWEDHSLPRETGSASGHISGTLQVLDRPHPDPR